MTLPLNQLNQRIAAGEVLFGTVLNMTNPVSPNRRPDCRATQCGTGRIRRNGGPGHLEADREQVDLDKVSGRWTVVRRVIRSVPGSGFQEIIAAGLTESA